MQGWQKTSFVDYPGKIASVLFYGGCNFRCDFCHNAELVFQTEPQEKIPEDYVISQISKKKNLYEGIVITGGEPTMVSYLETTIRKIKEQTGLPIKLDTNGSYPDKLKALIEERLVDYIAMDIKTSLVKYPLILASKNKSDELVRNVQQSVDILKNQKRVAYEFRSTVFPPLFEDSDLAEIATLVKGADHYYLQQYNPRKTLEEGCSKEVFSTSKINEIRDYFSAFVKNCEIR